MSNIIVLSGSVRKGGNTELLVQAFVDGAKKNNNVEVISVADYKVNPCIGCNTCFDREGHECFQKDDMTKVYEKLKMADVLVIASPVYFYGVSAQLKALIDRLHTPMRNEFKIKKLALILVGAAALPELFDARKSLFKVDRDLILLGIYYVIVIFGYLIFEMIPINYRPILIEGMLEASYPSSTTLLVLSVMPTLVYQVNRRSTNLLFRRCVSVMSIIFSTFMVIGRLIAGVHWFTDIVGAVILSIGLYCLYKAMVLLFCDDK